MTGALTAPADTTPVTPARRPGPLVALIAAHGASLTGNMITLVALPLYVLAETGSAVLTGVAGAFAFAPVIIGGVFGGVVVDLVGYRRASIVADLASGATMAVIPLAALVGGLPIWAVIALVFLSGLLDTPGQTARAALLPDAAALAGVPVERALGFFGATHRASWLVGAPLAGALVAVAGAETAIAVDAATFAAAALVVAAFVPRALQPTVDDEPDAGGYWAAFGAGVRFVARDPLLRAIVLLVVVTNLFDAAKASVLLPVVANERLGGAAALGLLVGVMGGGALIGSLLYGAVGHRLPKRATLVLAFVIAGPPPFLALAAGWSLWPLVGVFVLAGFAAGAINPLLETAELARVPANMRARVFGAVGAGCWAAMPIGALGAGFASERFGASGVLLVAGALYLLVALTPLIGAHWRQLP
ncbi:MFS transporter [Pilimelia columellifera]|uniref:MFS transporter n=1 Tax=Pilimelia columellifera subsp. columellifera TaxID=706583 RepID=A0ABN3NKB3_9ACTN